MLLYGLGLCYFHFSNFAWAKRAFLEVLYREPEFHCATEVHARLGLVLKYMKLFDFAAQHLNWALQNSKSSISSDRGPMSVSEIKFHYGHVEELRRNFKEAKRLYEEVIVDETRTPQVESATHSTLGWMLFRCEELGEKETRIRQAIQHLTHATQLDENSGQSWYFLGRCYSAVRDVNQAFNNYRKSIDKSEACADTWCSIGVLYQEQKQFMDALQAFICAVQLDQQHVEAWKDLGVLYEAQGQFHDALVCYRCAVNCAAQNGVLDEDLFVRVKALHDADPAPGSHPKLPSIEEAWTLPIPAELTQRQTARRAPKRNMNAPPSGSSSNKPPQWLMNDLEQNVLRHLQTNCQSLTSHQQAELERLEYGLMCTEFYKQMRKKNNSNTHKTEVDMDDYFVKPVCDREVDYAMELSAIKGRRVPGICAPTEFSHLVTATELIKYVQVFQLLHEKY